MGNYISYPNNNITIQNDELLPVYKYPDNEFTLYKYVRNIYYEINNDSKTFRFDFNRNGNNVDNNRMDYVVFYRKDSNNDIVLPYSRINDLILLHDYTALFPTNIETEVPNLDNLNFIHFDSKAISKNFKKIIGNYQVLVYLHLPHYMELHYAFQNQLIKPLTDIDIKFYPNIDIALEEGMLID